MGIPRKCPEGWSVFLGPPNLPRAAGCADISPLPAVGDWSEGIPGRPGRADAWGADPRLGPVLHWGEATLTGDLAKHRVDSVLREHHVALSACSALARSADPHATGVVRMRWHVDSNGRSRRVRVTRDTLRHRPTRACLTQAVGAMTFSAPLSGRFAEVGYTFVVGEYR